VEVAKEAQGQYRIFLLLHPMGAVEEQNLSIGMLKVPPASPKKQHRCMHREQPIWGAVPGDYRPICRRQRSLGIVRFLPF